MATLLAAYNFDEVSGQVLDYSGNGRHVTLDAGNRIPPPDGHGSSGGVSSVSSIAYLGGGTSGIPISTYETASRSASWWAKTWNSGGVSVQMVGWFQDDIPHNQQPALSINFSTTSCVLRATGSNGVTGIGTAFGFGTSGWHHFACTYDATTGVAKAYMDGVLKDTLTLSAPMNLAASQQVMADPYGVEIGGGGVKIDDVRLYNGVIDATQIAADMANPPAAAAGTVTGTLNATAPAVAASVPTASWSGSSSVPSYGGTLDATAPQIAISAPTADWSGSVSAPSGAAGAINATAPLVSASVPTSSWSGTVGTAAPVTGALVGAAPTVTAHVPSSVWSGFYSSGGRDITVSISGPVGATPPAQLVGPIGTRSLSVSNPRS